MAREQGLGIGSQPAYIKMAKTGRSEGTVNMCGRGSSFLNPYGRPGSPREPCTVLYLQAIACCIHLHRPLKGGEPSLNTLNPTASIQGFLTTTDKHLHPLQSLPVTGLSLGPAENLQHPVWFYNCAVCFCRTELLPSSVPFPVPSTQPCSTNTCFLG